MTYITEDLNTNPLQDIHDDIVNMFLEAMKSGNLEEALRLCQQKSLVHSYGESRMQRIISCFHMPELLKSKVATSAKTHNDLTTQIFLGLAGVLSIAGGVAGFTGIGATASGLRTSEIWSRGLSAGGQGSHSFSQISGNVNASKRVTVQHDIETLRNELNQIQKSEQQSDEQKAKAERFLQELASKLYNLASQILRRSAATA